MKKRYDVRGMMEWHTEFRAGRSRLKVSFTGGHVCGGAATPASFETSDPVVQAIIENSSAFKGGRIRIGSVMDTGRDVRRADSQGASVAPVPVGHPERPEGNAPLAVMEFKNKKKVSDFLQFEKGIPLERLLTLENCLAEGRRIGIDVRIQNNERDS